MKDELNKIKEEVIEEEVVAKEETADSDIVEKQEEDPGVIIEATSEMDEKDEKYYESVGRRKEAVARVRLYTRKSSDSASEDKPLITVNNKAYSDYFPRQDLQKVVESPLGRLKSINRFKATVKVNGGGIAGQADAIKHGLARALVLFDLNFAKKMKKAGFLTRNSKVKERRKFGLKKARKAPQWSKR